MRKFTFIGAGSLDFTKDLVRDILTFDVRLLPAEVAPTIFAKAGLCPAFVAFLCRGCWDCDRGGRSFPRHVATWARLEAGPFFGLCDASRFMPWPFFRNAGATSERRTSCGWPKCRADVERSLSILMFACAHVTVAMSLWFGV